MSPALMKRQCWECGGWYFEAFFRSARVGYARIANDPGRRRCRGCERTTRDAYKAANPFRIKALGLIRRHADKYIRIGDVQSRAEFMNEYRFNLDRVEGSLKETFADGTGRCEACHYTYTSLPDVTLDIHDRARRPFFEINTKWLCAECNSEKSHSNPDEWGAIVWSWDEWTRTTHAGPRQATFLT